MRIRKLRDSISPNIKSIQEREPFEFAKGLNPAPENLPKFGPERQSFVPRSSKLDMYNEKISRYLDMIFRYFRSSMLKLCRSYLQNLTFLSVTLKRTELLTCGFHYKNQKI